MFLTDWVARRRSHRRRQAIRRGIFRGTMLTAAALIIIGLIRQAGQQRPATMQAATPEARPPAREADTMDAVDEASLQSFPASDPPGWTGVSI